MKNFIKIFLPLSVVSAQNSWSFDANEVIVRKKMFHKGPAPEGQKIP